MAGLTARPLVRRARRYALTLPLRGSLHREALERIVPERLELAEPVVRYEFIRMLDSTGFGTYAGSAQVVPVRLCGAPGGYTHAMFLDAHPPIAGGRELWGFPQKLAKPSLKVERDTLWVPSTLGQPASRSARWDRSTEPYRGRRRCRSSPSRVSF
jgi:acetoacetate decarboxylase